MNFYFFNEMVEGVFGLLKLVCLVLWGFGWAWGSAGEWLPAGEGETGGAEPVGGSSAGDVGQEPPSCSTAGAGLFKLQGTDLTRHLATALYCTKLWGFPLPAAAGWKPQYLGWLKTCC